MLREHWYVVLESREIPRGRAVGITRFGRTWVAWRDREGRLGFVADRCIHRGASLAQGCVAGDRIRCPFHGFEYDASGRCRHIPAEGRARPVPERFVGESLPVAEGHGFIWVWWGEPPDALPPLPWFEDLDERFTWSGFADPWPVHYTRAIENQLDVAHLPFVHRTTIGRGGATLVDGPGMRLEGDDLTFWVRNRVDDGVTEPVRGDELPESAAKVSLTFRFPHLWRNRLGDKADVTLAFVPVDEDNTRIYMRFYQRFVRVPLLDRLVAWAGKLFSIVILRQDKRVVANQRPIRSELKMGEQLIPADRPIAVFRQERDRRLRP
jgi:phenylpropionate dioxygenase-like ring-hydroxylating dioxygenase large terminal subunit